MRPGLLCPGKRDGKRRQLAGRHSFNEAGAVMPRKERPGAGRVTPAPSLQ